MSAAAGTLPTGATESNYAQVPYILGGAVIGYNLGAGFDNVKLTAAEIAGIYNGTITQWSSPQIVATNAVRARTRQGVGGARHEQRIARHHQGRSTAARARVPPTRSPTASTKRALGHRGQWQRDGRHRRGVEAHEHPGGARTTRRWPRTSTTRSGRLATWSTATYLIPGNDAIQIASLQDKNGQWLQPTLPGDRQRGDRRGDRGHARQLLDR